jgi:Protein tyrosine and serine/threonine kinase
MTSLLGYQESGISHPSLWLGAYDADHPALSLHYKNTTCRSAAAVNEANDGTRRAFSNTGFTETKEMMPTIETNDGSSQDTEEATKPTKAIMDQSTSQETEEEPKQKDKQSNPAYTLFSKEQAKDLVEKTEERVQALLASSALLQNKCLADRVPTFTLDQDISRGDMLGMGGFAFIFRAQVKEPHRLLNHHQREQNKENCEYVLKHLSPDLVNQERKLHIGMRDFVMEAYYMATLDHPHILKLVGASTGGIANFGITLRTDAFFMVLPKLTCTLTEKLRAWKKEEEASRMVPKILEKTNRKTYTRSWSSGAILARQRILREAELQQRQVDAFFNRIQVVIDLLSALEYLHSKRLFHRGKQ